MSSNSTEKNRKRQGRSGRCLFSDPFLIQDDDKMIKKEKAAAREIRHSQWWKRRCSKGLCHYCGRHTPPGQLTMDHIVPLSRGGRSIKNNLVPACKECNNKKKQLLPMEWEEYLNEFK